MDCRSKTLTNVFRREDGDRISKLPDDLIRRILSFTDAKDAVQTSLLSTRWNNLWKSLSHLYFIRYYSCNNVKLPHFVAQFLRHRDHRSEISVFDLTCNNATCKSSLLHEIAVYGASHNLRHLDICSAVDKLPPSLFISQSLKHLSLSTFTTVPVPDSSWNLPALTTLFLDRVSFNYCGSNNDTSKSANFLSSLLNLKHLTLIDCDADHLKAFYVISPQLEKLLIKYGTNYFARDCEFVISAPKLISFKYIGYEPLLISSNNLSSLNKVHLDINLYYRIKGYVRSKQITCREMINMFHQLRHATFVTFTLRTIHGLSWVFDLLENQPSPFHRMECLRIEENRCWARNPSFSIQVLTYLCNSSPRCTVINECSEFFVGA